VVVKEGTIFMVRKNINDLAKQEFYRIPKLLVRGRNYKNILKAQDREMYGILTCRFDVSKKNKWIDDNGDIYFAYSTLELAEILNVSKNTVIRSKKRLSEVGLLEEVSTGRKNKFYLHDPEPFDLEEAKYIYYESDKEKPTDPSQRTNEEKQKISESMKDNKNAEKRVETDGVQNWDTNYLKAQQQGSLKSQKQMGFKIGTPDIPKVNPSYNELVRSKDFKDDKESDYDVQNTQFKNSLQENKTQETENELIASYINNHSLPDLFGESIIRLMKTYSFGRFSQFKLYIDKLIHSLGSVEKERHKKYPTVDHEALHDELYRTFNRVIVEEKQGNVSNFNSFLFISLKRVFENFADQKDSNDSIEQDSNYTPVPMFNWLEGYEDD